MYLTWKLLIVPIAGFCVLMVMPAIFALLAIAVAAWILLHLLLAVIVYTHHRYTHRKDTA